MSLPDLDGLELQQRLNDRRELPIVFITGHGDIPIVFITGQGDEAIRPRMMERGAVDVLAKPFSEAALLQAVNAALWIG